MTTDSRKERIKSENQTALTAITPDTIRSIVYIVRNQQVMFDFDLAQIYGYEVRALNQQVKRNSTRFPDDFMFELTDEEVQAVKSQIVISHDSAFYSGQAGGRRKPPNAFTEQGVYMLGTVLRGTLAEQQTVFIMRAFREMRHFIASNAIMFEKVRSVELRQLMFEQKTDKRLEQIFEHIRTHEESNQKVFFDGQLFDAFSLISDLIKRAKQEIILIDNYVDTGTLDLLSKKQTNAAVRLYTTQHGCKLTTLELSSFNTQYPTLQISYTTSFHDRFLVLDQSTAYHIGASVKDAGKKCFAISNIHDPKVIQDILQRL